MFHSEEKFDVTISIADSNRRVVTTVVYEGCPKSKLIDLPQIGNVLKEHLDLREQGIKHLEVTL